MKHTLIIRDDSVRHYAIDLIGGIPFEPVHEIILRPYKKDRSVAQNALYWLWATVIAGETGETKDEVHRRLKRGFLVRIYERDNPEYGEMLKAVRSVHLAGMKAEAKHLADQIVDLTSTTRATVEQFTEYLNDIEKDSLGKYVLPRPEDRYYEAMGIDR
jgi:hypothetical protein